MRVTEIFIFAICCAIVIATEISLTEVVPPNGTPLEITANQVRVRATACTDGRIIVELNAGAQVVSKGQAHTGCGYTWWLVGGSFGTGWTASNWLRTRGGGGDAGSRVAQWVQTQVGKRYTQAQCPAQCCRLGPNCYDCSGLAYVAWKMVGHTIPLSTHTYNDATMQRVTGQIRAGDLIWRHDAQVQHLQVYIGNNEIVEAANPQAGVIRGRFGGWMRHTAIWRPKGTLNATQV